MTTVRYGRYVLVNEKIGRIAWHERRKSAKADKKKNGGELFDTDETDPEDLEIILHHVRKNMGVE